MLCWRPSPKPVDGLKTLGSVVSRPSPKSPFAKVLVSATSAFWRRSPSWHRGLLRGLSTAPRQPISPSPRSRNDCPARGPTRSDGSEISGLRIHNIYPVQRALTTIDPWLVGVDKRRHLS